MTLISTNPQIHFPPRLFHHLSSSNSKFSCLFISSQTTQNHSVVKQNWSHFCYSEHAPSLASIHNDLFWFVFDLMNRIESLKNCTSTVTVHCINNCAVVFCFDWVTDGQKTTKGFFFVGHEKCSVYQRPIIRGRRRVPGGKNENCGGETSSRFWIHVALLFNCVLNLCTAATLVGSPLHKSSVTSPDLPLDSVIWILAHTLSPPNGCVQLNPIWGMNQSRTGSTVGGCGLTVSRWVRWCLARSLELLKAFRQPGCWQM